jgi:hypothetical protein
MARKCIAFFALWGPVLLLTWPLLSQTQTTGRIAGAVRDNQGAVIVHAEIIVQNSANGVQRSAISDDTGNYSIALLSPANYDVRIAATGFTPSVFHEISVVLANTTTLNATLVVAGTEIEVNVTDSPPLVGANDSGLGATISSRGLGALPLPSRNFLQLLTTIPGVTAPLANHSALGRNSPNVSVNGARVTQNTYEINGVDANNISTHEFGDVAVPAPESVSELDVHTSMYDASVGSAGGANVQVVTKSGSDSLHGSAYEYFRNEAFNANDSNLKAVGVARPVMKRNVYGTTLGGPIRKDKAFFFVSYQGTREANGATDQSLYKGVLITPGLTNDRSEATLKSTFGVPSIHPISLALLNARLPNGHLLIPTPQTGSGRVSGTAVSTYREEQFNANLDYRMSKSDSLAAKFFFADAPLFSALGGSNFGSAAAVPGFGNEVTTRNEVLSLQVLHTFSQKTFNEFRFGYSLIRRNEVPHEPINDSDLGIQRSTASEFPGLPLILLAGQDGAAIGTSDIVLKNRIPSLSFTDVLSLQRRRHNVRFGSEFRRTEWRVQPAVFSYGEIDFLSFTDFLQGNSAFSHLGTGTPDRDFLASDWHLFVQDDWKVLPTLTLNLGLRYELNLPPYDTQGRIGGFDPALYKPRLEVDADGVPIGPPLGGIVMAGNALPQYSLPGVPRVANGIVKSIDPNNVGPRIGLAWAPLNSGRLALRAGYGIFYSRPSFIYLGLDYFAPPFFLDSSASGQPFENPFSNAPPDSSFPLVQVGPPLSATVIDRNVHTPYVQQFNSNVQYEAVRNTTLGIAYVGSRGIKLFRSLAINQARIATLSHPIVNQVTGDVITINTPDNAALRAPLQGVGTASFTLNESTAQSTYHSLQVTVNRRSSHGMQFSGSYTFSKSIDNTSNPGGGTFSDGSLDRGGGLDTGNVWGNQLSARANRGLSDFDRTHVFVFNYVWDLPEPAFAHSSRAGLLWFGNWQLSGVVTAMSGLPVDIFDPTGGSLYGLFGARPNWAPGATRTTATSNIPAGYYFNPSAFAVATVQAGQPIPSVHDPTALAGDAGTDIGNVGRNVLRGPSQSNMDFSIGKHFLITESKDLEFRADLFNAFNHASLANPISDISTNDFGRSVAFNTSPRVIQLALRLSF